MNKKKEGGVGGIPPQNDSTYPVYFGIIVLYNNSTRAGGA